MMAQKLILIILLFAVFPFGVSGSQEEKKLLEVIESKVREADSELRGVAFFPSRGNRNFSMYTSYLFSKKYNYDTNIFIFTSKANANEYFSFRAKFDDVFPDDIKEETNVIGDRMVYSKTPFGSRLFFMKDKYCVDLRIENKIDRRLYKNYKIWEKEIHKYTHDNKQLIYKIGKIIADEIPKT